MAHIAGEPSYQPDWARIPPHVPTYANPPALLRRTRAEHFTIQHAKPTYQRWWDKWHTEYPEWREDHYRINQSTPVMRKIEHETGTLKPAYLPKMEKPEWRQKYLRSGLPEAETTRTRAFNRTHWAGKERNLYEFSNAMTSTQYKKPVPNIYGPMLRERVYGLNSQHNNHGFMNFSDYYF